LVTGVHRDERVEANGQAFPLTPKALAARKTSRRHGSDAHPPRTKVQKASLIEKADGVITSKDDLFDGNLQPGHDYFSFADSFPTNFTAR
jgi:hypothetical protein